MGIVVTISFQFSIMTTITKLYIHFICNETCSSIFFQLIKYYIYAFLVVVVCWWFLVANVSEPLSSITHTPTKKCEDCEFRP